MRRGLDELLNLLLQEMLAISRVRRVTGFIEMTLELVKTRLGKGDSQGDGSCGWCAAKVDPVARGRDGLFQLQGVRVRVRTTRSGEGLEGAKDQGNDQGSENSGIRKEWTHCCDADTGTVVRWGKEKSKDWRPCYKLMLMSRCLVVLSPEQIWLSLSVTHVRKFLGNFRQDRAENGMIDIL